MKLRILAMALALALPHAPARPAPPPAPLPALVERVEIPFETFTLRNGLRVVVHTDRKTPMVAVSVWYAVGSADEPAGLKGFAHLFEHLMFNGSGGWDGEYFAPLEEAGGTQMNGTTSFDRTNYFQNVPTGALDLALFLEADRMGNLLPAVTQAKLDNQRAVVLNEKRQSDNRPHGLLGYALFAALFPEGHPYRHLTIGVEADLKAATLDAVRDWFRTHYGPENAVLVLAGDIDVPTARAKAERWFGAIPRGPGPARPAAPLPPTAGVRETLHDRVPQARLTIGWTAPGLLDRASTDLSVALAVLAGGPSSRLHHDLVRERQLAVAVSGSVLPLRLASAVTLSIDVKPGVDPAVVERRVDELLAEFLARGPTADEVRRVATRAVADRIRGLEQVGGFGGKAVALAEGALYAGDPGFYRVKLRELARADARSVQRAARRWLAGPGARILTLPGERGAREQALMAASARDIAEPQPSPPPAPDRSRLPPVGPAPQLDLPPVERTRLSNGIPVVFARRATVPVVELVASFDAGVAADRADRPGTQALMLNLLKEGTTRRSGRQIAEELEALGARLSLSASADRTRIALSALVPNLEASLDLMADVIRHPAFALEEVERIRAIQLATIAREEAEPMALASRALAPRVFGPEHPYARASSGTRAGVAAVTRDDLVAFHAAWLRPETMTLFAVGDTTLAELVPALERAFGDWRPPSGPVGRKAFPPLVASRPASILLVDRPNSAQAVLMAGLALPLTGRDDRPDLEVANDILGGGFFTSRLMLDLRETKGWSYGVRSVLVPSVAQVRFVIPAQVQPDRAADSIRAIAHHLKALAGPEPPRPDEMTRAVESAIRSLPGEFETASAVLAGLETLATLGLPDDHFETLPARLKALDAQAVSRAAALLDPDRLQWVVVGEAATLRAPLEALGWPLTVRSTP
ncbi:MAG: insulinase family protein [Sphingomonadaceae bacterium]|uniref:M16 family metallopeptidase n=1 Tax=Thermaurantiacus sp. TaxID=2820283 RepID=UPI00298F233D|nr:pitrilysin family protein [Thermaurantiacus sp.]MCS6987307.1 insulinase family protein [Sphingomonadaceae bacterium]MDW8414527.1 pitrilysin family protein [Thermaurantiacus sp.]